MSRWVPGRPAARVLFALRLAAVLVTAARIAGLRRPAAAHGVASEPPGRAGTGSISVVIPARNEASRLGPCLEALRGAPGVDEVIVVDDESTDGTGALAARLGARLVDGQPLPPGWAGKAWALQQGIEAARGDMVVTLDADTRPDPALPSTLRDRLVGGLDLVSVAGRFDCPTPGSRMLHPALLTTLVYRFGRRAGAMRPGDDRQLANGQCMAFRRTPFLEAGGMAGVRGELIEDVALARRLAGLGWRVELFDAAELLTVRMFESLADVWHGWGRSIALPGVEPPARQLGDLATLTAVQGLPLLRVVLRRGDAVDAVALMIRAGTLAGTRRAYERPGALYWASVLLDPVAVARLALSIVRPSRTWRGRVYAG